MEEEKKRYYRIINITWEFMKNHLAESKTEDFWTKCVDDLKELIQNAASEDMEILTKMINAFLGDMQDGGRNGKA